MGKWEHKDVKRRSEYFERLVNVLDDGKVDMVCLRQDGVWSKIFMANGISKREVVQEALHKM